MRPLYLNTGIWPRRKTPHVRQTEIAECGLACIAMIAAHHGLDVDLNSLRRRFSPSARGASLKSLIAIADRLGLASRPIKLPLEALEGLELPALLHWDMNHYVVLDRFERGRAVVLDPAVGRARRLTTADLSRHFTGVALELRPAVDFKPADERQRLRLRQLWGRMRGWKRAVAQTVLLTAVLQVFALAMPYYLQLAVDSVVPALDGSLLTLLAAAFGLIVVFNAGAQLLRSFVLLSAGSSMGFAMSSNLARRLFRLPVSWFERRHVGDVLSRFLSVRPIQDALTQGLAAALVDGVLALVVFIVMLWYSVILAFVALAAFCLYGLIRLVTFAFERDAREDVIIASSRQQSVLIETMRGIVPLRLYGREAERHALWQNRQAAETNAALAAAKVGIWQVTANTLVFGLENVLTVWLAFRFVLSGGFSIGMVVGYLAYKQQFLARATALIDQAIAFRMLGLHLDRLGDIALETEDEDFRETFDRVKPFEGGLTLQGIEYRYSPTDALVLNGVDLDIPAGAHLAITGPSGGGKSTLAKIMLGLVAPTAGQVLIDGQPLERFGRRPYREQVAAVLQEDSLFAGSIADNIALFEDEVDMRLVEEAATIAAIHDEVVALPMGYRTLVGDMGSTLSGGQKARVLLARALFRRPKLLLMDEGTAHLDPSTEAAINASISSMGITRIIIAHREETIAAADLIFVLEHGSVREVEPSFLRSNAGSVQR